MELSSGFKIIDLLITAIF